MTMTTILVIVCGLGVGVGVVGLARSWRNDRGGQTRRRMTATITTATDVPMLAASLVGGALAALATGWPVALPIVGVAVYGLPKLFGQTSGSSQIAKIEAIANWTEMLQATLTASAGLGQAIIATAPLAPAPIRDGTNRLAARLTAGMQPHDALLQFADELEDPSADRVVCALVMAAASRAQRLGDLLAALADSTRDEVALRLRVETSRASVRSGVRTVLVFSVTFAVGLVVLAHAYLAPFGSSQGQLVLAVVGVLYGAGLTSMVSLSRPPPPVRLLGSEVVER